jgi:hypothetical protein
VTSGLRVRVGADGRGEIVGRDARWTFDVDVSTGSALIRTATGGEADVRVRGLRWSEKTALARFAGLGPRFRVRAIASACATAREAGGPDDDVVATLVAWLDDPGRPDAEADADDPLELASVTLELCRRLGLAPREIDDLPASEVADLWAAAMTEQEGGRDRSPSAVAWDAWADASPGMTRVVVLDDTAPAAGGIGAGAHAQASGADADDDRVAPRGGGGVAQDRPGRPAVPARGGSTDRSHDGNRRRSAATTARSSPLTASTPPTTVASSAPRAPGRLPARVGRIASDPPVLGGGALRGDWAARAAPAGDIGPRVDAASPSRPTYRPTPVTPPGTGASSAGPGRITPAPRGLPARPPKLRRWREPEDRAASKWDASWPWTALAGEARAQGASVTGPTVTRSRPESLDDGWRAETSSGGRGTGLGPAQLDALFAQLADELDQAATRLGIDEDG